MMKYICLILALLFTFGCSKDEDPQPDNQPDELTINFSNSTISSTEVDSVVLVVENSGVQQTIKLQQSGAGYQLPEVSGLTKELQIYSTNGTIGKVFVKTIEPSGTFTLDAPSGDFDPNWKTRIVFRHPDLTLTVGLSPLDPAFQLQLKTEGSFSFFYIAKEVRLRNGENSVLVGAADYDQFDEVTSGINNTSFNSLTTLTYDSWNEVEIYALLLLKSNNEEITFYYLGQK